MAARETEPVTSRESVATRALDCAAKANWLWAIVVFTEPSFEPFAKAEPPATRAEITIAVLMKVRIVFSIVFTGAP